MARMRKDFVDDFSDVLPGGPGFDEMNPIPQTPPDFGSDGSGVDVGSDPAGGNGFGGIDVRGGGGAGGSSLAQIVRALFGGNGNGATALPGILGLLGSLYGGFQARGATQDATRQLQESIGSANTQATGILNGASSLYKPYVDAGNQGLAGMEAFPQSNLAGRYRPVGSGRGLNLAQIVKG